MTPKEVASLIEFLASHYPAWRPTEGTVAAWSMTLAKMDNAAMLAGARRLVTTAKFAPSVAELLAATADAQDGPTSPEDVLLEIRRAIQVTQSYCLPEGLSPVAQRVVDCMGWENLLDSENPEAFRAHILRMAETFQRRERTERAYEVTGLPARIAPRELPEGETEDDYEP